MFFLLEDEDNLEEASVLYVSQALADHLAMDAERLHSSLPDLLIEEVDDQYRKDVLHKWDEKNPVRLIISDPSKFSMTQKLHLLLTPVYRSNGQSQELIWEGRLRTFWEMGPPTEQGKSSKGIIKQLFDNLPNPVVLLDFETNKILEANEGFQQQFGYTFEELEGRDIDDLIVPEDEQPIPQEELYEKGRSKSFTMEARRKTKTGEEKEVLLTAAPITFDGEIFYMFVIYLDRTEEKRLQDQLKKQKQFAESVIEGLPDTFFMFDEEQNPILWNRRVNEVTGYSDEERKRMKPKDFIAEADHEKLEKRIYQAFEEGMASVEVEIVTKDGNSIPYYYSGCLFQGEEKNYIIAYGTDISHLKSIEHELREANNEKKVLLEEIHHRIKNNLAHVSGILQLQSFSTDNEEVRSVMQESESRIQSIAMLHDQLYQHQSFKEVSLGSYIERLVEKIEGMWASDDKQIQYELDIDPVKLPINYAVPCGMMINELVTNATKHAFKDLPGGIITVSVKGRDDQVLIRVADDGQGLPDGFSLEAEDSLGMSLIQNFVRQLEGDISYKSQEGSQFTVTFRHPTTDKEDTA